MAFLLIEIWNFMIYFTLAQFLISFWWFLGCHNIPVTPCTARIRWSFFSSEQCLQQGVNKTCCFWNHFCLLCNMRTSLFSSSTYLGWYPRQKYVCRYILTYLFFPPTLFVKMMMKFLRFFFLKKYYTLHAFCFLHCFKITLRQCSH